MRKEYQLIIFLAIIIIVLAGFLFFLPDNKAKKVQRQFSGIQINSPLLIEGEVLEVSSPLEITGAITASEWAAFEGQAGTAELLDSKGEKIAMGFMTVVGDWQKIPADFKVSLSFATPQNENGTLIIKNENPSGLEEKNKSISIPVRFSKNKTVKIGVFFNNLVLSSSSETDECKRVYPSYRYISETQAVAQVAVKELLKGPTEAEKAGGFTTNINDGVSLQKIVIEDGVAKVDFDEKLQEKIGGSCKVASIRAQITQTLMQFPTVKSVVISINGQTEDILQP